MFSKQEQFEKDTINNLYGFVDSDYRLYETYGRHAKPDMLGLATLSKQVWGKDDPNLSAILEMVEKYCACDSADAKNLRTEENLLKTIEQMLDMYITEAQKYLDNLQKKSNRIFSDISDEEKNDVELKKKDLSYIINHKKTSTILNLVACFKMYFDSLVYGFLPAEPLPYSKKDPSKEGLEAIEIPVFAHEPISQDIPADKTGSFFDGLRTLAETDALFIKGMIRDCDTGRVYVRLFDPDDDFNQKYIEIPKTKSGHNEGGYCNWPGYIISAIQAKGLDIDSDPKVLFRLILGRYFDKIDISDYCTFSRDKIVVPEKTEEAKIVSGYKNCGLVLFASLLSTNSNMFEDTEQYTSFCDAVEEFLGCFSLSAADKQTRDAAIKLLKQHSDNFRAQATSGERRTKKRILACDVIDSLFEIYSTRPDENPYTIIREKYPQFFS